MNCATVRSVSAILIRLGEKYEVAIGMEQVTPVYNDGQ